QLFKNLHGLAAADKGYLSKKKEESLFQKGVKLITKVRRNMKAKIT
ncbi:TPA: IS982 family transposase, partial [Legionella pneumophila]|nr:IS982 family transposase [Legionella pneumophila]